MNLKNYSLRGLICNKSSGTPALKRKKRVGSNTISAMFEAFIVASQAKLFLNL
jgi:hypothetical protein